MKIKRAEAEDIWKMIAIEGAGAEAMRPLLLMRRSKRKQRERVQRIYGKLLQLRERMRLAPALNIFTFSIAITGSDADALRPLSLMRGSK